MWLVLMLFFVGIYGAELPAAAAPEHGAHDHAPENIDHTSRVDTSCYAFVTLTKYSNVTTPTDRHRCNLELELHESFNAAGTFAPSPTGPTITVSVRSVSAEREKALAPDGTLESMVSALSHRSFARLGHITTLRSATTLGSVHANLTSIEPVPAPNYPTPTTTTTTTTTTAVITAYAPYRYFPVTTDTHFFVVTVTADANDIDAVTDLLSSSWEWK